MEVFDQVAGFRWNSFNFNAGSGDPARLMSLHATSNIFATLGVLPASMDLPSRSVDIWKVLQVDPADPPSRGWRSMQVFARLSGGADVRHAREAVILNEQVFKEAEPGWYTDKEVVAGWHSSLRGVRDAMVRSVRPTLLLLLAAVIVVALVAATNAANLFLARTSERWRELAVRTAMGAKRSDVVGQLLLEGAVLSVGGGVLGVCLGSGNEPFGASPSTGAPRCGATGGGLACGDVRFRPVGTGPRA